MTAIALRTVNMSRRQISSAVAIAILKTAIIITTTKTTSTIGCVLQLLFLVDLVDLASVEAL